MAAGTEPVEVSGIAKGLLPHTTYYFTVAATSPSNPVTQVGEILSFTTPGHPGIHLSDDDGTIKSGRKVPLDLGLTARNHPLRKTVTISNHGSGPLLLEDLVFPAGFQLIEPLQKRILEVGEKLELEVEFTVESLGKFSGNLVIHSGDPIHPAFVIPVMARHARSSPAEVNGFEIENDKSTSIRFTSNRGDKYLIEYSSDLSTWKRIPELIEARGGRIEWHDRGHPDTPVHPKNAPRRFYRVWKLDL